MNSKILTTSILTFTAIGALLFFVPSTFATARPNLKEQVKGQLDKGAENSGLKIEGQEAPDVRVFGSTMINTIMGAYGIIFVILMVHAGHKLITAHGNQEEIESAYKIIMGAVIGLVLVLTSYSIAYFVGKAAQRATRFGTESININYE